MAITINTNNTATIASINLNRSNGMLRNSLNRLSSGKSIVNASDDAGGLAVSMKLTAAIHRSGAVNKNISNAISYMQVQDGAMSTTSDILTRMSELRTLSDDVTKNTSDIANYNTEFQQLRNQLKNIMVEKFNGISLFAAATSATFGATAPAATQLKVYTTEAGSTNGVTVSLTKMALESALNVRGSAGSKFNTTFTASNNLAAANTNTMSISAFNVNEITQAIENVAGLRAKNGGLTSRLQFAQQQLQTNMANLEQANSRIIDVDVASESTKFARYNILVQSGASMLSQANGLSAIALQLLQ